MTEIDFVIHIEQYTMHEIKQQILEKKRTHGMVHGKTLPKNFNQTIQCLK